VQERKQWVIEWETLAENYGERLQLGDPSQWSQWAKSILVHMDETYRTQFKTKSRISTTRMTHRSLYYDLGLDNYFTDAFTVKKIRTIFMARGEILPLSYIPNVTASDTVCPICNIREQKNVVHFIRRCPIIQEIRLLYFGKAQLQPRDVFNLLDGQCWSTLYSYINQALEYRNSILKKFWKAFKHFIL